MNISRLRFHFSSQKFYQLVQQHNIQIHPQIPEDAVLSKYINNQLQTTNSKIKPSSVWKKQKEQRLTYEELLGGSPYGSVQKFMHRNHELTLISTNYFRIDLKKLHQIIYSSKPDAILVQRRPQYHLHNFTVLTKGNEEVFSDSQYLNQLKFTPELIKKQPLTYRPLVNALQKNKDDALQQKSQKQILQESGFQSCLKYSSSYQIPLYFGQMPVRSYRQWIANTHTLMELQQIFKVVCHRLPRYKNISLNPYQMATFIYPEVFLKINDTYMGTLIEMLIGSKKYKKIVGIFGIIENQAVKYMLQKNECLNPIIQLALAPPPKGTIVRDIQNLEVIEKQILLDVMFFGKEVKDIKIQHLHTTNAVIQKYGKQIDKNTMMKFRYDKTVQYLTLMEKKYLEGQQEIKKQFVRQTLRQ